MKYLTQILEHQSTCLEKSQGRKGVSSGTHYTIATYTITMNTFNLYQEFFSLLTSAVH